MNYQGRLTDPTGTPRDTTVAMTFTIYADSVTTTARWSETHSSVTVEDGLFNVILGSVQMLDYSVFDTTSLWLGVKVGTAEPEISPRTRIVSTAFAQRVSTIDNTSGGKVYGSVDLTADLDVGGKATIGGNHTNTGAYGFVAGRDNTVSGDWATIGGGVDNEADGLYSTVPGGYGNRAIGDYSLATGYQANANHEGTFVFSDRSSGAFNSTGLNQFIVRAAGGVGIGTNNPTEALDVQGNLNVSGDIYGNVDNADRVDGQHYNGNWPTTLSNVQNAASNDFHNIGGTDQVNDAVADCADVDACAYTGSIKHWQWMSTVNGSGTIYDNDYVTIQQSPSDTNFQMVCGHPNGCTYVTHIKGVRSSGNLNSGDTLNVNMGFAITDARIYFAKRASGMDLLTLDVFGTNGPWMHFIGHDTK
jgi:hypothetical protein